MLKHELRKLYFEKRKDLSDKLKAEYNFRIYSNFNKFLPVAVKTVHIFLPIHSKNEIDTWPIIHELWKKEIQVVVPAICTHGNELKSMLLEKTTQLKENQWQVPEPISGINIDINTIDIIVLPLLAFDANGFRIGYGKGYYDNYLQNATRKALKIGLSYFPPVQSISNINTWDISLDYCITPDEAIKF